MREEASAVNLNELVNGDIEVDRGPFDASPHQFAHASSDVPSNGVHRQFGPAGLTQHEIGAFGDVL
jgi:hypothetical protein